MTTDILSATEDGIATISFNRLQRKNSITAAMYDALADALAAAEADSSVRAALLLGHESIFSAGNDIADFIGDPPVHAHAPVYRFMRTLAAFTKPLVAGVNGPAVGIGTTMLFHCDLVYAGEGARFAMPFVDLGLCPEAASSLLATQMLGYHRAAEALLLGEPLDAQQALQAGLVNRVLPAAEVDATARTAARRLAAKPLSAVMATKKLMKDAQRSVLQQHMEHEAETFRGMIASPAAKEAFAAFVEKRKPDFSRF